MFVSTPSLNQIIALRRKLTAAETPKELVDYLIAWVLESGTVDRDRLEKFEFFAATLDATTFSFGLKASRWRSFLDLTVGSESKAFAIACQWLPELADSSAKSFAL